MGPAGFMAVWVSLREGVMWHTSHHIPIKPEFMRVYVLCFLISDFEGWRFC